MVKFCNNRSKADINKYYVYLNCNEVCFSNMSLLFNEVLVQIKSVLSDSDKDKEAENSNEFEMELNAVTFRDNKNAEVDDKDGSKIIATGR